MVHLKVLALTGTAIIALTSVATAADLLPPPPPMEAPAPPISAPGMDGWYIRGDLGVGVNSIGGAATSPTGLSGLGADAGNEAWYNNAMSDSMLFDVGAGYQFNSWFRADVTGELRGGATYSGLQVINDTTAGKQLADFYKGNVSSVLGMVNGYADLGTWYGLTPYVGAGLGVAFNDYYGGSDQGQIYPLGGPTGGVFGANAKANLAWALMAGVDFNITHNLKLELGYRYLDYGTFKSGGSQCLSGIATSTFGIAQCGGTAFTVNSKELTSNDFRIGLRYYFDNEAYVAPPEQPLVRKY